MNKNVEEEPLIRIFQRRNMHINSNRYSMSDWSYSTTLQCNSRNETSPITHLVEQISAAFKFWPSNFNHAKRNSFALPKSQRRRIELRFETEAENRIPATANADHFNELRVSPEISTAHLVFSVATATGRRITRCDSKARLRTSNVAADSEPFAPNEASMEEDTEIRRTRAQVNVSRCW